MSSVTGTDLKKGGGQEQAVFVGKEDLLNPLIICNQTS